MCFLIDADQNGIDLRQVNFKISAKRDAGIQTLKGIQIEI